MPPWEHALLQMKYRFVKWENFEANYKHLRYSNTVSRVRKIWGSHRSVAEESNLRVSHAVSMERGSQHFECLWLWYGNPRTALSLKMLALFPLICQEPTWSDTVSQIRRPESHVLLHLTKASCDMWYLPNWREQSTKPFILCSVCIITCHTV